MIDNKHLEKPKVIGRRRLARQLALQFLYQLDVQKGRNLDQLGAFIAENSDCIEINKLTSELIMGAWRNLEQIDQLIKETSSNWQLSRISFVDRSNLRLAVFQLLERTDIPPKVIINEAIELAKLFSTPQSPRFINGVLDSILRKVTRDIK